MKNNYTGTDEMMQATSGAIKKNAPWHGAGGTTDANSVADGITVVNNDTQTGLDSVDNPPKAPKKNITDSIICLNDVQAKEIEWLWEPYIPLGKITLLRGNPGQGKTYFSMELASIVSNGSSFPGESAFAGSEAGNVLLLSAEDDLGDTIKPRLINAHADLDRIMTVGNGAIDNLTFSSNDFELLLKNVKPRLVIVDPIQQFLGSKVDNHKVNEVRPIMSKLKALAEKCMCAIVLIEHLNKNAGGNSIYRGVGSIDFTAAARSILMLGCNPDDESDKGICQIKNNVGKRGGVVGFSICDKGITWKPQTTLTADMIQGYVKQKSNRDDRLDEAKEFLHIVLTGGKQLVKDVEVEAEQAGISLRTLRRAREEMNITARKVGFGGGFFWELPNAKSATMTVKDNPKDSLDLEGDF